MVFAERWFSHSGAWIIVGDERVLWTMTKKTHGRTQRLHRRTRRAQMSRQRSPSLKERERRGRQRESSGSLRWNALGATKAMTDQFDEELHEKRKESLRNALDGTLMAGRLSIAAIGRGLAQNTGRDTKHAIKQVDRLVGNEGFDDVAVQAQWSRCVIGERSAVAVIMDWTDFDADGHTVIALHLVTAHGRATPLMWMTVEKKRLKTRRFEYESELIERLHAALPEHIDVTLLADRGFGDVVRYAHLELSGWHYVIRFRRDVRMQVGDDAGPAGSFVHPSGRATLYRNVQLTNRREPVPYVVTVHAKAMKEAWFLAVDVPNPKAADVVKLYGKRFTIEETFRDFKNLSFGAGLSETTVTTPMRRDRLLLLQAMAHTLLTLLGAAGERLGWDRTLKANTSKARQHSLYNQGMFWFGALPFMNEERATVLEEAFGQVVLEHAFFRGLYAVI